MSSNNEKPAKPAKKPAPKKPAEHPTYKEMIVAAIGSLKERKGSSRQAIGKYIQANYKVGDLVGKHLKSGLKRALAAGVIKQATGKGASGSFKLVDKKAEPKKPKKKKVAAKRPAAKKAKKPAAAKKAKKPAPKKAKKPAAKKPKKAPKKKIPKKKAAKKAAKKPAAKK